MKKYVSWDSEKDRDEWKKQFGEMFPNEDQLRKDLLAVIVGQAEIIAMEKHLIEEEDKLLQEIEELGL